MVCKGCKCPAKPFRSLEWFSISITFNVPLMPLIYHLIDATCSISIPSTSYVFITRLSANRGISLSNRATIRKCIVLEQEIEAFSFFDLLEPFIVLFLFALNFARHTSSHFASLFRIFNELN